MPILTGNQLRAAVIFRERLLNTLKRGQGKQSTPFRNSCINTAIRLIETEKRRPLDATETASYHASIRGLKGTLPGATMPLTVARHDGRTPERVAIDKGIRAAYADTNRRPSWGYQADSWRAIVDITVDPETRRLADEILPACPVEPRNGAIISMDHTRPAVDGVDVPIVWQNGTKRSTLNKFMDYFRNSGKAEL